LPRIDLVLSDDWELFGDGSGDMRKVQFDNLRTLTGIYEEHGLHGSFNAEVMQQLYHLSEGQKQPRLLDLANEWSELLRRTFANGHDVQLHLHPQWHEARYTDGRWVLPSDWMLGNHPPTRIRQMLQQGKHYLEQLLQTVDANYRCVAFRAGAWALAPSPLTIPALIDAGIFVDTSIAPGMVKTGDVDVDYTMVPRQVLPYYPRLDDARQVSATRQPLICVPTHTFEYTPLRKVRDTLRGQGQRFRSGPLAIRLKSFIRHHLERSHYVSDLSTLSVPLMRWMLEDIRRKASFSGAAVVPVVVTNHTKDLADFRPIRQLARLLAEAPDIQVITLRQLAANLHTGRYPIGLKSAA
jgi:hypothetical protein